MTVRFRGLETALLVRWLPLHTKAHRRHVGDITSATAELCAPRLRIECNRQNFHVDTLGEQ